MLWGMYSGYGADSFHQDFSALSTHPCPCLHLMNFHQSKQNKQHHQVNNHRKQESVANI